MEQVQLYLQTIKLNNDATCYLLNGDCSNANSHFVAALKASRQLQMSLTTVEDDDRAQCGKNTENDYCLDHLMEQASDCGNKLLPGNDQEYFIYQQPIRIPISEADEKYLREYGFPAHFQSRATTVSTAVIFNLALCHHLTALTRNNMPMLQKAAKLYELASELRPHNDSCTIFLLATINNLGQIHQILKDASKSEQCFRHLLMALMFLMDWKAQGNIHAQELAKDG